MIKIASSSGIDIYAREDSFITFMNSPFLSHRELRAVDIFPLSREYISMYSPVSGKIVYHKVHTMKKNGMKEHVTILDSGPAYVKMLHIAPYFDEGDRVDVGDELGLLYKSPYFRPWSDPHIHLEIRPKNDFLRARGGLRLHFDDCEKFGEFRPLEEYIEKGAYILRKIIPIGCGKFYGAGDSGIIDGGYPHYGFGLLIGTSDPVLFGERIGEVIEDKIVKFNKKEIFLNGKRMRGIGLNIYLTKDAYIKYIYP
ncbi:MAG: hypothetical protein JHC29_02170 [Thermoplasmata archaeon]|nr:hypothetical protein [Thermoplasmata archaeon]